MAHYTDNVQKMLKRWGLSPKYEHAGIYCIKVDDRIVYVGKSTNMIRRISEHYVGVKIGKDTKYRILAEVQHKGHPISFDVLYDSKRETKKEIEEEIGAKEAEYIRQLNPILNIRIPREEDWRTFDDRELDAAAILKELL